MIYRLITLILVLSVSANSFATLPQSRIKSARKTIIKIIMKTDLEKRRELVEDYYDKADQIIEKSYKKNKIKPEAFKQIKMAINNARDQLASLHDDEILDFFIQKAQLAETAHFEALIELVCILIAIPIVIPFMVVFLACGIVYSIVDNLLKKEKNDTKNAIPTL